MLFSKKNKSVNSAATKIEEVETIPWLDYEEPETEGQLAIDVYQNDKKIIIKSTIAGVKPENLKITLHHDLLTIKGTRSDNNERQEKDYLYQECYWGSFSRSIILPAEVDPQRVEAELENGILTITLHKNNPSQIEVKSKD